MDNEIYNRGLLSIINYQLPSLPESYSKKYF
jgi:hypothetical protein